MVLSKWDKFKLSLFDTDYFTRSTWVSFLLSLLLIIVFSIFDHTDKFFFPEAWYLNLMPIIIFFNTKISAFTTMSKIGDLRKSSAYPNYKYEYRGALIGIALGLAIGIALAVVAFRYTLDFLGILDGVVLVLSCINTFGGLCVRLGRLFDSSPRPAIEKPAITLGGIIGLALSIGLLVKGTIIVTVSTTAFSVVGITSFLTGGAAIPIWIGGAIFVMNMAGSTASVFDYGSRLISVLRRDPNYKSDPNYKHDPNDTNNKKNRPDKTNEYQGAALGIVVGLIIGVIAIVCIAVFMHPTVLVGALGVVAGTLAVFSCMSMVGGFFSRIGRFIDRSKSIIFVKSTHEASTHNQTLLERAASVPSHRDHTATPPKKLSIDTTRYSPPASSAATPSTKTSRSTSASSKFRMSKIPTGGSIASTVFSPDSNSTSETHFHSPLVRASSSTNSLNNALQSDAKMLRSTSSGSYIQEPLLQSKSSPHLSSAAQPAPPVTSRLRTKSNSYSNTTENIQLRNNSFFPRSPPLVVNFDNSVLVPDPQGFPSFSNEG